MASQYLQKGGVLVRANGGSGGQETPVCAKATEQIQEFEQLLAKKAFERLIL